MALILPAARERAQVRNEAAGRNNRPFFIEIENEHGGNSMGMLRFNCEDIAQKIADAINDAYRE